MKTLAATLLALALPAGAHEGHGLPGGHWHATDVWGFALALALAVAGAALWWRRRK